MNIIVLMKQAPDTETSLKIDDSGKDVVAEGVKMVMNPFDEYAAEEAIKIAREKGGRAKVVTVGGKESEEAMRTAIAMGIPEAERIEDPGGETDCMKTARLIAAALKDQKFDIIFTGKQAVDDDASSVGPIVAELLGAAFVSNVVHVEVLEAGLIEVHRESVGGYDVVEMKTPCVISCQKGLNKPRYPKLMGLMKAKKKKIPVRTIDDLGVSKDQADGMTKTVIKGLIRPPARPPGKVLKGEPKEIAQEIAASLFKKEPAKAL